MKVILSSGRSVQGITIAEESDGFIYFEDENTEDGIYDQEHDADIVKVDGCVSIVIKTTEEVADSLDKNYVKYADEHSMVELSPVSSAEQEADDELFIEFGDNSTISIDATLQCAYTY